METSTVTYSSSSPPPSSSPPQQQAEQAADLDAVSLGRLSANLERLLDPAFLRCADTDVVLASGGGGDDAVVVGVHRCILAARSNFFLDHFSSLAGPAPAGDKERPRLVLAELVPGGRHIGRDALVAVLGYLYTGRLKPPPRDAAVCVDERCPHEACRPAIDFVVESTYAASGFQISELVSLFQRRLSDFVNIALVEDIVPIVLVASTCQLHELLSQCIQRVAGSSVDSRYLEKELPDEAFAKVKEFRRYSLHDDSDEFILDPEHAKKVRNIHKALDCDDVDLVGLLLQESAISLDDAFAIHYAAAYCEPKVLAGILNLVPAGECVNVNLKNDSGYTPLHLACMRREPQILLSLIEKGASVVERTRDGRDALTICKRLTTEKDCNKKFEKCKERSKAYLCIDILEQEIKRKSFIFEELLSAEVSVATPLLVDNFHMRLINLENRVAFARIFFPSEAKLVMRIAQADSTEEFAGLTSANFNKLKEVDLNETPTMQNKRLRERLDALTKTVELGRKYFPHCSDVLDKFLMEESTDLHFLESGTAEDQCTRRSRFSELKEDVRKAFSKDKAVAAIASSTSSSSPRGDGKEGQNCGFVSWVDPEWPPSMQNALLKLWEMYQDSKSDRRNDNLESSLTIHHLTEEKNKLEATYDKLVEDVHQLLNAQEDRVIDFRYLQGAEDRRAEVTTSVVSDMKTEMEKKDAEMFKLQEKYAILMNLTRAQATVIRNLKANHLKEKEVATAAMRNLQFQVDELTKCQEKLTQENLKLKQVHECTQSQENLTQENLKLKDQIADMKKGHDELSQENLKLKDQIADMKKGHDELSQENIQLKDHMGDLKKGHDKLNKCRVELKLQVSDLLKAEEKNKQKMNGIQAILDG